MNGRDQLVPADSTVGSGIDLSGVGGRSRRRRRQRNGVRWGLALGLAFLAGVCDAAADENLSLARCVRHGLMTTGPVVAALKMTLERGRR